MNRLRVGTDFGGVYGTMPSGLAALEAVTVLASGSLFLALFWVFAENRSNVATWLAAVGIPTLIIAGALAIPAIAQSSDERTSEGYLFPVLVIALALVLSQVLALWAPRAFGLFSLLLLNCLGIYMGCRVMRLTTVLRVATLVMVVLTLAILGFASLWMSLVWIAAEGPGDRESVHVFWPPTVMAVWFLGSAALLLGGRSRLLLPYFGICLGALIAFALAQEAALYLPIPFGLVAFLGLNLSAVSLAWNSLLGRMHQSQ